VSQTLLDGRKIIHLWQVLMGIGNNSAKETTRARRGAKTSAQRRSVVRSSFNLQLPFFKNCGYLIGALLLFVWNWQLILATAAGIISMLLIYRFQGKDWHSYKVKWQHLWENCDRRLTVAIASGGLTALIAYTAAAIWSDTDNPWLAFGSIVQGLLTLATLSLVIWNVWRRQERQNNDRFDELLADLASDNQLKCLMAVRKTIRWVEKESLSAERRGELLEYFRLLLSSQDSPTMKAAILDGLAVLEIEQFIDLSPAASPRESPPLEIPINLKVSQKVK
jgi:membrane protein implicated in regulation of membrane protease activity